MIMKRILFAFIALVLAVASAQALTIAQRADSAYNAENYRLAIDLYRQALAHDGVSANVYYNLGNAYYRIDKLGSAVANYERALRLNPADADARQNLEFVKSRIQDRPEDDTAFLASLHHSMVQSMTANAWAWTAFVIFLLFMGAVALYIFATGVGLRKTGFFGGIVLLVMLAYSLCAASDAVERATAHSRAVVIVPSTQLSSAPEPRGRQPTRSSVSTKAPWLRSSTPSQPPTIPSRPCGTTSKSTIAPRLGCARPTWKESENTK